MPIAVEIADVAVSTMESDYVETVFSDLVYQHCIIFGLSPWWRVST